MELVKNIKENEFGKMEGEVYFGYINKYIQLKFKKNVPMEYVIKTAEKLNELDDSLMSDIFKYSIEYYKDTIESYPDIIEDINVGDDIYTSSGILKYMEFGTLVVNMPENTSDVGIHLDGGCDWDEEGIQWIVKDNQVVYVGAWQFQNMWRANYEDAWDNYATIGKED